MHWRFSGTWYVEGAAGPDDFLLDSSTTTGGSTSEIEDDKRECGWARIVLGRSLWRRDRLDMQMVCGIRYLWENTQDNSIIWDDVYATMWTRDRKLSNDSWDVFLAIRPSWEISSATTLSPTFGFVLIGRW